MFRGRFKGILVEEDSYLLQVIKYIHGNPVKAGLVDSLSGVAWSSHKHFISSNAKTIPKWMETDYILGCFSARRNVAIAEYKNFMRQEVDEEVERFYSKKNQSPILGGKSFVERIKSKYILGDRELNLEIKGERVIRGLANSVRSTKRYAVNSILRRKVYARVEEERKIFLARQRYVYRESCRD